MNNEHIFILTIAEPRSAAHGKLLLYDMDNQRFATNKQGDARTFSTRSGARGVRSLLVNNKRPLYTG
jgi:hypothetical protein